MAAGASTVITLLIFAIPNTSEGILGMLVNFTVLTAGYLFVKSKKGKINE